MPALITGNGQLVGGWLPAAIMVGQGGGAVGRAAGDFFHVQKLGAGVRHAHDDHAVVDQSVVKRRDGRFLAAMLGAGGYKDAANLADKLAARPEAASLVKEIAHLRAHVAETRRRAENDCVVVGQFGVQAIQQVLQPRMSAMLAKNQLGPLERVFQYEG